MAPFKDLYSYMDEVITDLNTEFSEERERMKKIQEEYGSQPEITIHKSTDESSGSELEQTGSTMFSSTLLTVSNKNRNQIKIRPDKQRLHMRYEKPIMVRERKAYQIGTEEKKARKDTNASTLCDSSPN